MLGRWLNMASSYISSLFKNKTNKNPTCLCQLEHICKSRAKTPHSYGPNGIWDDPTGNSWVWMCLYPRLLWHATHFWTNFWHHHPDHMNGTQKWKRTSHLWINFWKEMLIDLQECLQNLMLQRITWYMTLVVTSNIWVLCVTMTLGQSERRSEQHTGNINAISVT